jgi:hypothetical protein
MYIIGNSDTSRPVPMWAEEEDTQQQEEEQEDENYDNDIEDGNQPQQEVKEDVAAALMTGKVGDTHLSSGKDENPGLANCDPPPKPSEDKLGSYGDSWTDDEFNNNSESDEDGRRPSPAKRKRLSSSNNGPTQKKRKHHLEADDEFTWVHGWESGTAKTRRQRPQDPVEPTGSKPATSR